MPEGVRSAGMAAAKRERKPQERSERTHARLLEAAIDTLSEVGFAGATMAVIARRAGVSRGASQHHFRTRDELLTAAVLHVAKVRSDELRRETSAGRPHSTTLETLEVLASFYLGPLFSSAVQVWVGAASDARLRAQIVPLEAHVGREAHKLAVDLLGVDEEVPGTRELVQATLDLMRGLGLASLLRDDTLRRRRVLRTWADTLDRFLPRKARRPARPRASP